MSEQKQYVNSMWFEEKSFTDGGSILKVNIKADELIKFLNDNKDESGSVKIVISKKRTLEEGKSTHYATLDTWKPTRTQGSVQAPVAKKTVATKATKQQPENSEELI